MADYFSQGAGANYGPLGYGGGPASGAGNLANTGYQWGGPTNVGQVAYQQGQGATQANPFGGDAGIRPYNLAIGGSAPAPFIPPVFGNTMGGGAAYPKTASSAGPGAFGNTLSPEAWNRIAAYTNPDVASPYANSMKASTPSSGFAIPGGQPPNYGPGAGPMTSPYGPLNIAPDPGPNSSAWDFQNNAYNTLYGQGGKPANLTGTDLGNNNLNRGQIAFQNAGGWGNQTAGGAMRGVFGAEGAGGNPFALNYSDSGATGMNQLTGDRLTNYVNSGGGSFDYSPEAQAQNAVSEIQGSNRYAPTANALNNPDSTVTQMQRQLVGNYEGLSGSPWQMNRDLANAAKYGTTLTSLPSGGRR